MKYHLICNLLYNEKVRKVKKKKEKEKKKRKKERDHL